VKVDLKHNKVESENDQVRVLRTHLGPKESSPMHEHPPSVLIFLTDARLKITLADGKTEERTHTAGSARYRPNVAAAGSDRPPERPPLGWGSQSYLEPPLPAPVFWGP